MIIKRSTENKKIVFIIQLYPWLFFFQFYKLLKFVFKLNFISHCKMAH